MWLVVTLLLALHGLIHVLGFLHARKPGSVPGMKGRTIVALAPGAKKAIGFLWLLACVLLCAAAALAAAQHGGQGPWWKVAIGGVLLSQALVILAWPDAKAGTLPNLLLIIPIAVAAGDARMRRETDTLVAGLLSQVPRTAAPPVTKEDLAPLPEPIRRWLEGSGVVGKPRTRSARLVQRGGLRTAPEDAPMPAEAQQYFAVESPSFVWRTRVTMFHFIPIAGRDSYLDGRGRMLIRAGSLVSMVDAAGPAMDQGSLLRYLGEIVWFPSAALAPYIRWEPIDAKSAKATMTWGGASGSAVFVIDEQGRFASMTAQRYFGGGPDAKLEPWFIPAREWREFHGVRVPSKGDVTWRLETGDFTYYEWEIVDLEHDVPEPFPSSL